MNKPTHKYPKTPHAPWSPSRSEDAIIAEIGNFTGKQLVMTEKMDGSNVLLHAGTAHPRSVSGQRRQPWLGMVRKHHAWKSNDFPDLHFYGEDIYGVHAIEYDPVPEDQTFRLFAVREQELWLPWEDVVQYAQLLDLPTVPVLFNGRTQGMQEMLNITLRLMSEASSMGPTREGVVTRVAGEFSQKDFQRSVFKTVRPNHVQPDEEHWSKNWTPCRLLPAPCASSTAAT